MEEKNAVANFYRASAEDFKKIPGSPIAYWIKNTDLFQFRKMQDNFFSGGRNKTHNNEKYLRNWWEINISTTKWKVYENGGDFRKYFGNQLNVIDWSLEAREFYDSHGGLYNSTFWGKEGITWSLITSAINSFRIKPNYSHYSSGSPTIFNNKFNCDMKVLALLNSPVTKYYLRALNPTLNTTVGDILSLPLVNEKIPNSVINATEKSIDISKEDWDSYETSWDFTKLPLLKEDYKTETISTTYKNLRSHWQELTSEMRRLEEENNRIFIEAYGLEDELTPAVPLEEITLTCNPYYRYGKNKSEEGLERLLLADTMREYVSYAVGCIFGRYSLDKEGLVLANAGDDIEEYYRQIPEPTFVPDESGILPVTADEDYADDLPAQFRKFLRISFGEQHYRENNLFIEEAIGKDIRNYFLKNFYSDHVKRYKKRPIYWMISSPNGSFKALIYLHRYHKDTINRFLNDYLRPYQEKIKAKIENNAHIIDSGSYGTTEKNRAQKQITEYEKQLKELYTWEKDVVYPLASQRIELDLDDGVKVNYGKLGAILDKVKGLND